MAQEQRRACGYRKIGGTYLVSDGIGEPCDRLPFPVSVCSCCGQGIKQGRGWTWVDVGKLVGGRHMIPRVIFCPAADHPCNCRVWRRDSNIPCTFCHAPEKFGRAGLLWIGAQFYKTPAEFLAEGQALGISRRVRALPRGFKLGETWVLLAHPAAVTAFELASEDEQQKAGIAPGLASAVAKCSPGLFCVWKPERVEKILPESARGSEEAQAMEKRGITPVFLPEDDPDHQGSVFDDVKNARQKSLIEEAVSI